MKIIKILILTALASSAQANGFYVFTGAYAYDDGNKSGTMQDYKGVSPDAYYGIKYAYNVTPELVINTGWKHQSSLAYREIGGGFNGFFFDFNLKIF